MLAIGRKYLFGAVAGVAAVSAGAHAASVTNLEFDLNSLTIQATDAANHPLDVASNPLTSLTGSLNFSKDSDSTIGVCIDGVNQTSFSASFYSFYGQIQFIGGVSQGGSMTLQVQNGPSGPIDTYNFDIVYDALHPDKITKPAYSSAFNKFGFQLKTTTTNQGFFNDANFGGVNIAPWYNSQNPFGLDGAFFELKFIPDAHGLSTAADVDIRVETTDTGRGPTVPVPSSAAAGLGLLGLLAVAKWRRGGPASV